ncbi:MAG: four helix bundle protein [Candidatus Cloacimonetes bacterium]|nr:four helix bundle protein [Candidatus Cloacimonadota bacterium]
MKKNEIEERSLDFAIRIVKMYQYLCSEKKEYVLSKQVLRSGTSIGAMVREAEHGESKADFIHKMSIALKEAYETDYWLILMKRTGFLTEKQFLEIEGDMKVIIRMLIAIVKSAKQKDNADGS